MIDLSGQAGFTRDSNRLFDRPKDAAALIPQVGTVHPVITGRHSGQRDNLAGRRVTCGHVLETSGQA